MKNIPYDERTEFLTKEHAKNISEIMGVVNKYRFQMLVKNHSLN